MTTVVAGKPSALIRFRTLSRRVLADRLPELRRLDRFYCDRLGPDYTTFRWSRRHFAKALPGKWALSQMAVDGASGRVAGFIVASATPPGNCHLHRVLVAPDAQGLGILRGMFARLLVASRRRRLATMTVELAVANRPARAAYRKLGFREWRGRAIARYLAARGRAARVVRDRIVEADGSRYRVMARSGAR